MCEYASACVDITLECERCRHTSSARSAHRSLHRTNTILIILRFHADFYGGRSPIISDQSRAPPTYCSVAHGCWFARRSDSTSTVESAGAPTKVRTRPSRGQQDTWALGLRLDSSWSFLMPPRPHLGPGGVFAPRNCMRDLESAGELLKHTQRAGCLGTCYVPEGWAGGVHIRRKDRAEILLLFFSCESFVVKFFLSAVRESSFV